jgi:hypothetical protein
LVLFRIHHASGIIVRIDPIFGSFAAARLNLIFVRILTRGWQASRSNGKYNARRFDIRSLTWFASQHRSSDISSSPSKCYNLVESIGIPDYDFYVAVDGQAGR